MLKKLMITTAISGLMLSSAMAQSSPSGSGSSSQAPAASSDSMKPDASKSTIGASTSGSASTISAQKADQLLASNLKGADVLGADDKKIGDVSDILFSKDGKIEAYILSVGGFLGVGAKEVALAPSSVQLTQDKDTWKLKVSMTKDQLAQAPNFEHYKAQRTTTGTSSSSTGASSSGTGAATAPRNAPNPGGMAPNANPPANRP